MNSVSMVFFAVSGLQESHPVMLLWSLMIVGMLWMQFVLWMGRMVGVWNFLIIRRAAVEAVEVEAADVDVVEGMI